MKWVIKHMPTGKFVFSRKLTVVNQEFSRRFNSVKQAKAYIRVCNPPKNELTVVEYTGFVSEGADLARREEEIFYKLLEYYEKQPPAIRYPIRY